MKWDIQTVGFTANDELISETKEKLEGLLRFYDNIVGAEVYLKLDYNNKKENKSVEIKLNVPGEDLYAGTRSDSFERALLESVDKIKRQISKKRTRENPHI